MIEDHGAPMVPEARRKNETIECVKPTKSALKEEADALRTETAFVPMVKRSSKVVN